MNLNTSMMRLLDDLVSSGKQDPDPPRLLVVDDEDGVRQFIARVLCSAGYRVEAVASGDEAIETVNRGEQFDLVVSDVRMAGLSGPQFVEQLRRRETDMKVLYVTGYSDQLFFERETLWQDEAYLDKPFTTKGLLESVALLLSGHIAPPGPGSIFGTPQH